MTRSRQRGDLRQDRRARGKAYSSPEAAAAGALSAASGVLFMTTAGVIAAATLSIGVLTAVGPLFIAMFLMPATRGLFAGWVRALVAAALVLMLGWLGITLLLSVLEPWLVTLAREQQEHQVVRADRHQHGGACLRLRRRPGGPAHRRLRHGVRVPLARAARGGRRAARFAVGSGRGRAGGRSSRAQRLAFDLQREPSVAASRAPLDAGRGRAPHGRPRRSPANQPTRLGDDYRRPAAATRRLRVR